jgi:MFS family permease
MVGVDHHDDRPPPPIPPGGGPPGAGQAWLDAIRGTLRVAERAGAGTRSTIRRATNAQGAGESGLAKLTELTGVASAGDAAVTIALAGTLFFSASVGQARGRVALYLLITMVPFALLSPLIGPMLDKFRSGRRYALAVTFVVRALLAWTMAGSVDHAGLALYPAVFGVLIAARAFGVTRAAGVPRLLPPTMPLVRANSWMNMSGLVAGAVAGGLGAAITHVFGPDWTLRAAAGIFALGAVLAVRLPKRIDSAVDERPAAMTETGPIVMTRRTASVRDGYVGPSVELGLNANMAFRGMSGFLTFFLAFLLRQEPIGGLADTAAIGLVLGAAGVGSLLGTGVGALIKQRAPERMLVALLILQTVMVVATAAVWSLPTVLGAGLVTGFTQTLGKLGLDAMLQRDVDEDVRASAFARSETRLQLAWVAGGGVGIGLPLRGDVGFGIASGAMIVLTLFVIGRARDNRSAARRAIAVTPPDHPWQSVPAPPQWDSEPFRPAGQIPFPPVAAQRPEGFEPPYPPAF